MMTPGACLGGSSRATQHVVLGSIASRGNAGDETGQKQKQKQGKEKTDDSDRTDQHSDQTDRHRLESETGQVSRMCGEGIGMKTDSESLILESDSGAPDGVMGLALTSASPLWLLR